LDFEFVSDFEIRISDFPAGALMLREFLEKLVAGQDLTEAEARRLACTFMDGEATPAQMGAVLTALRAKRETPVEVLGFVRAMKARAVPLDVPSRPITDTCGTGGDRSGSFNISTLAALVVAAAGAPVVKHGNRAASSQCGSADFLQAMGIRFDLAPEEATRSLDETGFAFLMAPRYHPATAGAAAVRRELKIETIFNLLGPLTNPASPEFQLIGVSSPERARKIAAVLQLMNACRAFVVHNELGWDELVPCGRNRVTEVADGAMSEFEITVGNHGLRECSPEALRGGPPEENARIGWRILRGESGPQRDTVLLNAGCALAVAGKAADLREGIAVAGETVDSGRVLEMVERLRRLFPA
jgi:anthranilate phosphoribosyltransferase